MASLSGISPFLILFIVTALAFDFLNGFHDSANTVATLISSRTMEPRKALVLGAVYLPGRGDAFRVLTDEDRPLSGSWSEPAD